MADILRQSFHKISNGKEPSCNKFIIN